MAEEKLTIKGLKAEMDENQKKNEETQSKILDLLEGMSTKKPDVVEVTAEDSNPEFPKQYKPLVEKYFDPEDGFDFRISWPEVDDKGREMGGLTFTIVVPEKLSNAPEAHWKYYKHDIRMKALSPGDIAGGIERYCQLVVKNLGYDKRNKIK